MGSIAIAGGGGTTKLTADTTYYVATTGSDTTGNGSIGKPWLTPQHACDVISRINTNGFVLTLQIEDGTYNGFAITFCDPNMNLVIQGNAGDYTKVVIKAAAISGLVVPACFALLHPIIAVNITIQNMTFDGNNGGSCLVFNKSTDSVFYLEGTIGFIDSINTSQGEIIENEGVNCSVITPNEAMTQIHITNNWVNFYDSALFNTNCDFGQSTITLHGVPNFTESFIRTVGGSFSFFATTFVGTATGFRIVSGGGWNVYSSPNFDNNLHALPGDKFGRLDFGTYDFLFIFPEVINTQTSNYTLALADANQRVEMNLAGANTVTVPPASFDPIGFLVGSKVKVTQIGAGATTIVAGAGVTIHNVGTVGGQWQTVVLYNRGADEWVQTSA